MSTTKDAIAIPVDDRAEKTPFIERFLERHPAELLEVLLADRTTGGDIVWADSEHEALGVGFGPDDQMSVGAVTGAFADAVLPRTGKAAVRQTLRTKVRAEVFTPSWLCNRMNNWLDTEWFGRADAFNTESADGRSWRASAGPVRFSKTRGRGLHAYLERRVLEAACGEAPFLTSRYDATTGEAIPVAGRAGLLDRKLRCVGEHARSRAQWERWALDALKATYGFEYQGDNLLIARVNALLTFCEHCEARWGEDPGAGALAQAAHVISWNLWQMDGLTCAVPTSRSGAAPRSVLDDCPEAAPAEQLSLFDLPGEDAAPPAPAVPLCCIYDWDEDRPRTFAALKGNAMDKFFYAVIGNPPYQEENDSNGRKPPIYHHFMDGAYEVAEKAELITPARFLFNAGQTPTDWNEKMLSDKHLKVLEYESDASKIFPDTDIKGGIAITLHDDKTEYEPVGVFTVNAELNSIIKKVDRLSADQPRLDSIFASQRLYKFSDVFYSRFSENPIVGKAYETGARIKIVSSLIEKLPEVFLIKNAPDSNDIKFLARIGNARQYRYIAREFLQANEYIDAYKLFIPEANNSGVYGETLAEPLIGYPGEGSSDTFLNAGPFETVAEAQNLGKYYKTKFFRSLLGIKKVTQHSPAQVWRMVPLQDFTPASDIDWTQDVAGIDRQLYAKYGLSPEEIEFIETHVKEMS